MNDQFIRLTASLSGKPFYVRPEHIAAFGADTVDHAKTKLITCFEGVPGYVIVDNQPDEIAETLGLEEQTA